MTEPTEQDSSSNFRNRLSLDSMPKAQVHHNMAELYYELVNELRSNGVKGIRRSDTNSVLFYEPVNGGILNDFKSLLHYKIIGKLPGLYNIHADSLLCCRQIGAIFEKYNEPAPDDATIRKIDSVLDKLACSAVRGTERSQHFQR